MNPPNEAQFYPFFTTTVRNRTCTWQEGGNFILGTRRTLRRKLRAEFGQLLQTLYPVSGFTTALRYNNFNSGDTPNPCRSRGNY